MSNLQGPNVSNAEVVFVERKDGRAVFARVACVTPLEDIVANEAGEREAAVQWLIDQGFTHAVGFTYPANGPVAGELLYFWKDGAYLDLTGQTVHCSRCFRPPSAKLRSFPRWN